MHLIDVEFTDTREVIWINPGQVKGRNLRPHYVSTMSGDFSAVSGVGTKGVRERAIKSS